MSDSQQSCSTHLIRHLSWWHVNLLGVYTQLWPSSVLVTLNRCLTCSSVLLLWFLWAPGCLESLSPESARAGVRIPGGFLGSRSGSQACSQTTEISQMPGQSMSELCPPACVPTGSLAGPSGNLMVGVTPSSRNFNSSKSRDFRYEEGDQYLSEYWS